MTLLKQLLCGGVILSCTLDSAHSAAVPLPLIDYSPHGKTKLSGDFGDARTLKEQGSANTSWTPTQGSPNFQLRGDLPANTVGPPQAGTATQAVIGRQGKNNGEKLIRFGQSTGHKLEVGDKFEAEYSWLNAAGWNSKKNPHTISFVLFYTDSDKIDGVRTILHQLDSTTQKTKGTWQAEVLPRTKAFQKKKDVGKTLFVEFSSNAEIIGRFARLDNVYLGVTSKNGKHSPNVAAITPTPKVSTPVTAKPTVNKPVVVMSKPTLESAALVGIGGITISLRER